MFDENLTITNTYKFSKRDINKFIWMLWKSVYLYKYMDDLEKKSMKHHYQRKKIFTVI